MPTQRPAARSFRDLVVWQKAHELVLAVYRLTETFPDREKFGLSHPMRCAAVSIPANIAEGFGKRSQAEKARFLNIAESEIEGLRFWDGNPTVRLLRADEESGAMLMERCEPGIPLRSLPEPEQDLVIAGLLRRLWRVPSAPHCFRPLSDLMSYWREETLLAEDGWSDAALVREGLRLFQELPRTAPTEALLATDLHAGNVLQSRREPWLVIDPKPFIGDPAYDATQHLLNCIARLLADPHGTICRIADLLELDRERVRLWTFARAASEPRDDWSDEERIALATASSQ